MSCPTCGGDYLAVAVPPSLRPYAPAEAARVVLCTACLRVTPETAADAGDAPADADAGVDWSVFPSGEAGVATVLLVGLLDSLALRRADVRALVDHAEAAGGDPLLALNRLAERASRGELDPHVDLARRTAQLESLLA